MKEFIDKLSSYNIFNYLLPGALYAAFAEWITDFRLIQKDPIIALFIYYFLGLVISRVGSLCLDPILKKVNFVRFAPYENFISATESDAKINLLSETNNTYRTLCALFICLLATKILEPLVKSLKEGGDWGVYVTLVLFCLLFAFSYRKQASYVAARVARQTKAKTG